MEQVNEALNMLGYKGVDKITGAKGVITSVSVDLYGCIQVILTPEIDDKGNTPGTYWRVLARIKVTGKKRVLPLPEILEMHESIKKKKKPSGPAEKPIP